MRSRWCQFAALAFKLSEVASMRGEPPVEIAKAVAKDFACQAFLGMPGFLAMLSLGHS